jgi:hypothetical protein
MTRLILVALVALMVGFGAGAFYGPELQGKVVTLQQFNTVAKSHERVTDMAEQSHNNFLTAISRLNACEERERVSSHFNKTFGVK